MSNGAVAQGCFQVALSLVIGGILFACLLGLLIASLFGNVWYNKDDILFKIKYLHGGKDANVVFVGEDKNWFDYSRVTVRVNDKEVIYSIDASVFGEADIMIITQEKIAVE